MYLAQRPPRGTIRVFRAEAMILPCDRLPGLRGRLGVVFQDFRLGGHVPACEIAAAVGGAIGLALALAVILILGKRFASLDAGIVAGGALGSGDGLMLLLGSVAGVALAMLTARLSMLSSVRGML